MVLGVDGGGTKTKAVVIDEQGQEMGHGRGEATNIRSENRAVVVDRLVDIIDQSCESSGIISKDLQMISLGLAGVSTQDGRQWVKDQLSARGFKDRLIVFSDAAVALAGAHGGENGIIAIAGTGMAVFGQKDGANTKSGGWGHILGDEGSAYWIGLEGIKAALAVHDDVGPKTALRDSIQSYLKLTDLREIIDFAYNKEGKSEIASLARLVMEHSTEDTVAQDIIDRASSHLFAHLKSVNNRLGGGVDVCLLGGLLENETPVLHRLKPLLANANINVLPSPKHSSEFGAALLGMRQIG